MEDSKFYSEVILAMLNPLEHVTVDYADTSAEGIAFLDNPRHHYDLAIVDLNLPDTPTAEFARETRRRNISTVVFSSVLDHKIKEELFDLGIIDYVAKDSPIAVNYLQELVEFLIQQSQEQVLVVTRDNALRREQVRMLENLKMSAWACSSPKEALRMTKHGKNFSLALVGHDLEEGNGVELVCQLRRMFNASELAIVAIPGQDTESAAQYLRFGANDFLRQPYSHEEFQCRIRNAVKMQHQLDFLQHAATRDYLTKLLNRRAFFEVAGPVFARSVRNNTPLALAMFDIDHFKNVNDTYGHSAGDTVLQVFANLLTEQARSADILARFGGEEFCLLMPDIGRRDLDALFNRYQASIREKSIALEHKNIKITTSIGIASQPHTCIETLIKSADKALYEAKETGRDKFIIY
ncbi:MAG: diguanylate cyclase [Kordiimonadaceae bacterium]|nr:diguanylate cyclase [Kordiimonadaceae bacterium]